MNRSAGLAFAAVLVHAAALASPASDQAIAEKLATPVADTLRLVVEDKWGPVLDEAVQKTPAAAALGDRWSSATPAWQKIRKSIGARITKIVDAYVKSGAVKTELQRQLALSLPGAEGDAVAKAFAGPGGSLISGLLVKQAYVTTVMSMSPKEPRYDDPAYGPRTEVLFKRVNDRLGVPDPKTVKAHEADLAAFYTQERAIKAMSAITNVLQTADVKLSGAINLGLFDNREAINRELDAAIASVK